MPQNHCAASDPSASNVCRAATCDTYPVDCGNYCCAADFPVCAGDCYCNP